jgi:hypothetical protein
MPLKRLATLAAAALCALAISACGANTTVKHTDNLGPGYVYVGSLYYQVQISRELNPFSDEDSGYLEGLTKTQRSLPPGQEWFAVFMQVFNRSSQARTPSNDYYITDTLGDHFTPLVNPDPNSFTYQATVIPAGGQLPSLTSLAYFGPTQGEALIFKIPSAALDNRPFILHIVNPQNPGRQASVELDV